MIRKSFMKLMVAFLLFAGVGLQGVVGESYNLPNGLYAVFNTSKEKLLPPLNIERLR